MAETYKGDIDTNRTDRFSSLYVIISKIGLGCVTYFMVGLVISIIYVLSDMDYFTLNGQFRNQRFFTDDGYYYTKQLVIIYGLFAFILTMFIGPVGIIPCIIWSWLLTISYISMSLYMNSTNPDKYNKMLIRFIGFISFISHSLLCNFIFYLFYPMNSMFSTYIYDYDIKLTNTSNNSNSHINSNNNNSRDSYTFYRILSFMGGYFIGCSLLSFVLSIKTDMSDSLYPINNHNNVMILLLVMLIASSISMLTSLLLSFQFVYEYIIRIRLIYKYTNNSNIDNTSQYNDLIDKSRYMLDSGTFVWFPINKHTNNVISKNFHTIIDIEMLFVWILNPFIITLIPYTIPSHFQFRKQSYINKLLFSLIFIIIFMFLNEDLIFSYLFPNEYMNTSVFNIIYSNQYIQLNDDHLYLNPISLSNSSNINCGINNVNNKSISNNSSFGSVPYPHFDDIWDYLYNENNIFPSFIYESFLLLNISNTSVIDINSSLYYSYLFNESNNDEHERDHVYYYNEHNYNMMSVSLNPINHLFSDISNTPEIFYSLENLFTTDFSSFSFLYRLTSDDVDYLRFNTSSIIFSSITSTVSIFEKQYKLILTNKEDNLLSNQTIDTNYINRFELEILDPFVLNLLSSYKLKGLKILISLWHKYTNKGIKILTFLKSSENCYCVWKIRRYYYVCFYKILLHTDPIDSNPYSIFHSKSMFDRTGNYLCLCFVIMYILRPNVLICLRYLVDLVLDKLYTSYKRFDKNSYSHGHEEFVIKFILIMFEILDEFLDLRLKFSLYCGCFCKNPSHNFYSYYINTIIYISSLLVNIFTDDIKTLKNKYKHILNLMSLIKYSKSDIALKDSKVVDLKECKCVCSQETLKACDCYCTKDTPNKCRCIICKNYKIICLNMCFGCQLCCICCNERCQCHVNRGNKCPCNTTKIVLTVKKVLTLTVSRKINVKFRVLTRIVRSSNNIFVITDRTKELLLNLSTFLETTTENILCSCQNICEGLKSLGSGTCSNGGCCKELCNKLKECITPSSQSNGCTCKDICEKINGLSSSCTSFSGDVIKKIKDIVIKCDGNKKCCCKIGLSAIRLLYKTFRLISYYQYNESRMQCLFCYNNSMTGKRKLKGINIKNCRNYLITSKNNRICDTMCNSAENTSCGNGNNKDKYGNPNIYNNNMDNNGINHNDHKLKQSRVVIALGLILLILMLRMSFDIDDKNIYKSNNKLIGQNIENNNLLGSMYDIFVNNNMIHDNNQDGEYNIQDDKNTNDDQNNSNNSNTKQNKMMYFMTMLVSLISALYMNMVIRNMYDKLRLEYDIWSYLINMILMTGMMSSLISKYSVHIFDFVGVLDKYGMNLYKSESFIDYVDKGDTELIDNISSPVKNMMMYGLFKSMTKDLTSLIRYTDVSTTSSSKTTYSKMKNKLCPYKEMSKPIHRITKYCDKCQHSLCKIHKSVINNLGNDKSIDIVSVLDFLSYTMIYNQMSFINQYESYFSGDELYMIWKLNKHVNNNVFVTEYYRHQTLNKIEQDIKQLVSDNKLGSYNLLLLWEIFGENEIRNITLKSMSDINDQQMIQNQRDILLSVLYDEYLSDFYNFQEYVCNTYLNTRFVSRSESLSVNNINEFTNILNKHILDKSKIQHLANIYTKNTHDRKIKSLMLPTVSCNITGIKDEVSKNIKLYCDNWLKYKRYFCKHLKSPYCEEAVNIAYNTIIDLVNKPDNLYQQIHDLLTNMDLKQMDNIFEKPTDYIPKSIQPICKDCESMSLYYINQYLSESLVNIDRMLRPLGMYLSWNGTPILSQHLHKYGHKY